MSRFRGDKDPVDELTSPVSVQGSCLAGSRDLAMGGSSGEPGESLLPLA
jgi:hypothetical protein